MLGASSFMQAVVAIAPASTWPSAPRFQQRILNAGVTASEIISRIAVFWRKSQVFLGVPKEPLTIAEKSSSGFLPVASSVTSAHSSTPSTRPAARMARARPRPSSPRLEIWIMPWHLPVLSSARRLRSCWSCGRRRCRLPCRRRARGCGRPAPAARRGPRRHRRRRRRRPSAG